MTNSRLTIGASVIVFLLLIFAAGCSSDDRQNTTGTVDGTGDGNGPDGRN